MGGLGAPEIILILIVFGGWFGFAAWGYYAGAKRTIGSTAGLLLGLVLGLIGILIVYCTRKIEDQQFYSFPPMSAADELQKYKQLLDSGAITEAEYNYKKSQILGR